MDPHDDSYQDIRLWLGLKRHEQPPPGYFERLPDRVLARIQRTSATPNRSWIESVLDHFELRPAAVGLFGIAAGSLYVFGLAFSNPSLATATSAHPASLTPDPWSIPPRAATWREPLPAAVARLGPQSSVTPVLDAPRPFSPLSLPPGALLSPQDPIQRAAYSYSVWAR
jgi:hypothetical protein